MEKIYPIEEIDHLENENSEKLSEIQQYFAGATAFVTGATGFLGRLLVEKLLRTCPDIKRIYILVRPKKGKSSEKRFEEYFDDPLYDPLKREKPKSLDKLSIVEGDCALPDLGLHEKDRQRLISEVNCVFHVAATVRFDEKLRLATYINVRATRDIMRMCKEMKDLRSVVHVSTAFSFCHMNEIDEVFYEPTMTGDQLLTLVDTLKPEMLDSLLPTLLGKWPNTYVFTKSVAEEVVKTEGVNLPVALVRPSIVIATSKEPLSGWIDNYYGATGIFVGATLGLIRTLYCDPRNVAEMVPADCVINNIIAAAWDIASAKSLNLNEEEIQATDKNCQRCKENDIPVYNYVSSAQKPITWGTIMTLGNRHVDDIPTCLQVWHYFFWPTPNKLLYLFLHYFLHILPAYLVDCLAFCIGKKPQLVKGYAKITKFMDVIAYFSSRQWKFHNDNAQKLWKKLSYRDKELFQFDMGSHDWDLYFYTLVRGVRLYLLKDPLETMKQGLAKRFKLKIAHYTLVTILFLVFLKVISLILKAVFY